MCTIERVLLLCMCVAMQVRRTIECVLFLSYYVYYRTCSLTMYVCGGAGAQEGAARYSRYQRSIRNAALTVRV
jgi:hypothetical protein